jgi:hypothetical protein
MKGNFNVAKNIVKRSTKKAASKSSGQVVQLVQPPKVSKSLLDALAFLRQEVAAGRIVGLAWTAFHPGKQNFSIDFEGAVRDDQMKISEHLVDLMLLDERGRGAVLRFSRALSKEPAEAEPQRACPAEKEFGHLSLIVNNDAARP